MTKEKIFEQVQEAIAKTTGLQREEITMDASFDDLGMDSLDGLSMINDLEEMYGLQLSNEEIFEIKTVRSAVDTIHRAAVA